MTNQQIKLALEGLGYLDRGYRLAEEYYRGKHRLSFSTDKFRQLFAAVFADFKENLCPTVVDTLRDRLRLENVFPKDEQNKETPLKEACRQIWERNRLDRLSKEVHFETFKSGDAYLIVWPDEMGQARLYLQKARTTIVFYDENDSSQISFAAKFWKLRKGVSRCNLYYPDRVEKYATTNQLALDFNNPLRIQDTSIDYCGTFEPFLEDGDDGVFYHDYGRVPVFHFANNVLQGEYGVSELQDVIPLQDALNKALIDQIVAQEFVAMPQRWATGLEFPIDPETGKAEAPLEAGVNRIWSVANEQARFGEFGGADLAKFVQTQESFRNAIFRVSGVPAHYGGLANGGWPSGEALKTSEARLTTKVEDRQTRFGNTWEDIFKFALLIDNKASAETLEMQPFEAIWTNTAPRSRKDDVDTAIGLKQLGVSDQTLQEELGYDPEEEKEKKKTETEDLGETLIDSFNRGLVE